jgi:biotin transporter BioY
MFGNRGNTLALLTVVFANMVIYYFGWVWMAEGLEVGDGLSFVLYNQSYF